MDTQSLSVNLRLLCSYVGSIAACCRKIGINRQQFSKYLSGQTQPSIQNLRKICNYFGVDTEEIFYDPNVFSELVSSKKRPSGLGLPFEHTPQGRRHAAQLQMMVTSSLEALRPYVGDYYYYYMTPSYPGCISKGFARISLSHGMGYSHCYERARPEQAMLDRHEVGKFTGVVLMLGDRLQITDYSVVGHRAMSQTILYGAPSSHVTLLSGLTMGIQGRNSRVPFTARVVYEKISEPVSLRAKLKGIGLFEEKDAGISSAILSRLTTSGNIANPHLFSVAENY